MKLSDLGEFGLIAKIRERFPAPDGVTGIGDDCALLPPAYSQDTLVSTDMLVEGTHFLRKEITPYDLGWKSAAVNLSDIAAMGGKPTGTFLSLALPANLEVEWVDEFLRGYGDVSARFDTPLLGGDTTASPDRICINVTVLGACQVHFAKKRGEAKVDDLVCVTGTLGDSAGGLKAILKGVQRDADVQKLIERHYRPVPRVKEGQELRLNLGVHAMMDISDGIGSDLLHILEASDVDARVDLSAIPLSIALKHVCTRCNWDPLELAVRGGEDYELLFTCTRQAEALICVPHFVIGTITKRAPGASRITWFGATPSFAGAPGYDHFRKP